MRLRTRVLLLPPPTGGEAEALLGVRHTLVSVPARGIDVLVVDDSAVLRQLVTILLAR